MPRTKGRRKNKAKDKTGPSTPKLTGRANALTRGQGKKVGLKRITGSAGAAPSQTTPTKKPAPPRPAGGASYSSPVTSGPVPYKPPAARRVPTGGGAAGDISQQRARAMASRFRPTGGAGGSGVPTKPPMKGSAAAAGGTGSRRMQPPAVKGSAASAGGTGSRRLQPPAIKGSAALGSKAARRRRTG